MIVHDLLGSLHLLNDVSCSSRVASEAILEVVEIITGVSGIVITMKTRSNKLYVNILIYSGFLN